MREVLTKRFWQDVKKTFDKALEDVPVKANDPGVPAEVHPGNIESAEAPTPPADLNNAADIEEALDPGDPRVSTSLHYGKDDDVP
jgi:hypothetical protein